MYYFASTFQHLELHVQQATDKYEEVYLSECGSTGLVCDIAFSRLRER